MSQLVKDRFNRMLDSAIVVVGTKKIIPALVFTKIGRYSAYIEHYYMHTPNTMILIVEPISKPWNRSYVLAWREELLEVILLKLASTALVAGSYYTYVHCFMARYFVSINLLRKLAFALEEGYTFDEEDPDLNVDMHYLFKTLPMDRGWKLFSMLHIWKVPSIKGKQIQNCYCIFARFWVGIGTLFLCGRFGRVSVGWKETMDLSYLIW